MKPNVLALAACTSVLIAGTAAIAAAAKVDPGKREYDANCASCHGVTGKGDGPYAPALTKAPADLTVLRNKNGGSFPFDRVYDVIEGRAVITGHGTREIPIWGSGINLRPPNITSTSPTISNPSPCDDLDPRPFMRSEISRAGIRGPHAEFFDSIGRFGH